MSSFTPINNPAPSRTTANTGTMNTAGNVRTPLPDGRPSTSTAAVAGSSSAADGKMTCQICGARTLPKNMKRHIMQFHEDIYDEDLSARQMFAQLPAPAGPSSTLSSDNNDGNSDEDNNDNDNNSTSRPQKPKVACPLCTKELSTGYLKKHLSQAHNAVWAKGLTVEQILERATWFPDLDDESMDVVDEDDEEPEYDDNEHEYDDAAEGGGQAVPADRARHWETVLRS